MDIGEVLYVHERRAWRQWLWAHFQTKHEIWLVLPHKASGRPSLLYNDAVEEALCVGWIDSIKKKLRPDEAVQRYTPRRGGSAYSQPNKERLMWLLRHDLVHRDVRAAAEEIVRPRFVFPPDILKAIQRSDEAWRWFRRQTGPYRRIRVAYVEGVRNRPEEFDKRLAALVKACQARKRIGYGGIEKYY